MKGSRFTIYERDTSEFDEVSAFSDDEGEFGEPDLEDVGAALLYRTSRIFFFNKVGTQYAAWNYKDKTWSRVYSFTSEFGGGGAPIASVGGAVYVEGENAYYLFNRNGTRYTIYNDDNRIFSAAFDVTELGNGSLSFD